VWRQCRAAGSRAASRLRPRGTPFRR
jgi:hypothetical protein